MGWEAAEEIAGEGVLVGLGSWLGIGKGEVQSAIKLVGGHFGGRWRGEIEGVSCELRGDYKNILCFLRLVGILHV